MVERMSYNDYVEKYGGGYEEWQAHSTAYYLQQNRQKLRPDMIKKYEALLKGTRYEVQGEQE